MPPQSMHHSHNPLRICGAGGRCASGGGVIRSCYRGACLESRGPSRYGPDMLNVMPVITLGSRGPRGARTAGSSFRDGVSSPPLGCRVDDLGRLFGFVLANRHAVSLV
jgi:hypothetical protein